MSIIRDISLAPSGENKIEWVRRNCPLLRSLEADFSKSRPFAGKRIALSIHLEAKTAYLCQVLAAGGAEMYVTGSNPLSTQDDVAAALVKAGLNVFAWHGATDAEYSEHIRQTLSHHANIIIDDGGDLVHMLHTELKDELQYVIGGCEEWDGINRTTNLIVAGKYVVVAGYGWCGKGVAMRAKGLGAKVIVTEVNPIRAIEAVMDGFEVLPMREAARLGDLFVTVTGCAGVITEPDFMVMKEGAVMCNAGHFDVEVDVNWLRQNSTEIREMRANIMGYTLPNGRHVYVLAEGRLVNLAAGDGHPAEIMDMSFAIQALSARYLVEHAGELKEKLIDVPAEVDLEVANRKLAFLGVTIDRLTPEQEDYLNKSTV